MKHVIKFGTDGIRGNAEQFPFTDDALVVIGRVIGSWYTRYVAHNQVVRKILIGCDTRESCERIKKSLYAGLMELPLALVDVGVFPTPAVLLTVSEGSEYDLGIVISASHNPYQDNGIKIFRRDTGKLSSNDEAIIEQIFEQEYVQKNSFSCNSAASLSVVTDAANWYAESVIAKFPVNFLQGVSLVIDCAYGAMAVVAPVILRRLGAQVIALNTEYTGTNINDCCGALHPELLQAAVIEHKAQLGIGFDGDGDRIVAVNFLGHACDGDDILAVLLDHSLYNQSTAVVGTVMSNLGFEYYLKQHNKELKRVAVGDKYIAACLEEFNLVLGGEPSGHIILRDYLMSGDGLFVGLRLLQAMLQTGDWSLSKFTKWPQVTINVPVAYKKNLGELPFAEIIAEHQKDLQDGRLVVRYSGTESVLRVMTESSNYEATHAVACSLAHKLQSALNNA